MTHIIFSLLFLYTKPSIRFNQIEGSIATWMIVESTYLIPTFRRLDKLLAPATPSRAYQVPYADFF